ncbi:MAG: hypothetical protein M3145_01315, partial [Pseudomonadota bacterium]|nr:hypothetical protein [Pseudomonadota bacterium]
SMAEMVRLCTVRRGLDPRDFVLVPSGGAGPLHAVAIAREVGFREVLVPPLPGMFSALGSLLVPVRHDVSVSIVTLARDVSRPELERAYAALRDKIDRLLSAEQEPLTLSGLTRTADMRFRGQLFELNVDLGEAGAPMPDGRSIEERFRRAYAAEYGFDLPQAVPEIVTLRLAAVGRPAGSGPIAFDRPSHERDEPTYEPWSLLRSDSSVADAKLIHASGHPRKDVVAGPAIIATNGATIWLPEDATAKMLPHGAVRIRLGDDS